MAWSVADGTMATTPARRHAAKNLASEHGGMSKTVGLVRIWVLPAITDAANKRGVGGNV